jgi:ABC-type Fe3+-hydroxamate transport system substrate-binding protein
LGRTFELDNPPQKIVSLSPSITEILFNLGYGKAVVGVSSFCKRPPETKDIPIVGNYSHIKTDMLKDLNPDLIFVITGYQRKFLEEYGSYNIFPLPLPLSVYGIIDMLHSVSLVIQHQDKAIELEKELLKILEKYCCTQTKKKVYVEFSLGGPVTFGAFSYITHALNFVGFQNIYGNEPLSWITPDYQYVKVHDPDIIIYEHLWGKEPTLEWVRDFFAKHGLDSSKAYKNNAIFITPGKYDFLAHHGPSFIKEAIPWLSSLT